MPEERGRARRSWWPELAALGLAAAGWLTLSAVPFIDEGGGPNPWQGALWSVDSEPPWENTLPIDTRRVPKSLYPAQFEWAEQFNAVENGDIVVDMLGLDAREWVVRAPVDEDTLKSLTASGRPPEPGTNEVLGGVLVRRERFPLDGAEFQVVGQLRRDTPGLAFSYLLPADPAHDALFSEETAAEEGWLAPDGVTRLETEEGVFPEDFEGTVHGGMAVLPPLAVLCAMAGLSIFLAGGAAFEAMLILRLCNAVPMLRPFAAMATAHPLLFAGAHVVHFGCFLFFAAVAAAFPLTNLSVMQWIAEEFLTGSLSHVGQPYVAGDLLGATWNTFKHNFLYATCVRVLAPSLVVPGLGTLAGEAMNFLALGVAGFVLAPLWSHVAAMLPTHAVTIAVELEAYALAGFVVLFYPLELFGLFFTQDRMAALRRMWAAVLIGIALIAAILALAAFYEAVTLVGMISGQ